jgi:hypothetical protein
MAIVSAQPAASPNGTAASGLSPGLNLIAVAPNPERCAVPPRGDDPYQAGVLRVIDRVVGMNTAAIGPRDIELMARLDQARACLKRSAPPKGPELPSWLSAKSNSRNGDVNSAKKELILAAQNLAERRGSLDSLWTMAQSNNDLSVQLSALVNHSAPAASLTAYQSSLLKAQSLFFNAEGRYRAARERVMALTCELTNELQSQRR